VGDNCAVAESSPSDLADPVLDALDVLMSAARDNIVSWVGVMERVEAIRERRRTGIPYSQMQIESTTPRIIDTVSRNQERLGTAAAALRRTLAHVLAEEGMSHADIARAFGVSRQRVGMLLRNEPEPGEGGSGDANVVQVDA
jgi:predicted XRE-type DNA-binding protein